MLISRPWFLLLLCALVLLMIDTTQAARKLQQSETRERRLLAYGPTEQHAPAVKSFQVSDGSWVDCVPIEQQIAAHHPALKDHVIHMMPSSPRPSLGAEEDFTNPQWFAAEHGSCPEGSIPVQRRDSNMPLLRKMRSPVFDGHKVERTSIAGSAEAAAPTTAPVDIHEYAITGLPTSAAAYSGAGAIFSVNGPLIDNITEDFSLSQFWIVDGSYTDSSINTIEVGWQTYPNLYKTSTDPRAPHLFIFWTADAYKTTGCYNLECSGFVQTDSSWVIGGAMPAYTTLAQNAATPVEVHIEVIYDSTQSSWWLFLGDKAIGYWPLAIHTKLQGTANLVQWGGEIAWTRLSNSSPHTKTTMGSGAFPSEGYPRAAYHRNLTYANAAGDYLYVPVASLDTPQSTDANCYDIVIQQGGMQNWGTYFFFGGPGGENASCVGKLIT